MNQQPAHNQPAQSTGNDLNFLRANLLGNQGYLAQETSEKKSALSNQQKLAIFESVLDQMEVENTVNNSVNNNQNLELNPPQAVGSVRKEAPEGGSNSAISPEATANIQYVEEESTPELPLEVEKFIKEVQEDENQAPEEIVIADDTNNMADDDQYVSKRVVVLPITPEVEKRGKKKSPKFSIRWLVEWSRKIVKLFEGEAVYKQPEKN